MKMIWRFFSRLLASLLCTVLLLCLLLLPLISFVGDMADPSTLVDLVFSSGILETATRPSAGHPHIVLSNAPAASGSTGVAGEPGIFDAFGQLASSVEDTLDLDALTEALETLANSDLIDMAALAEELGIPADAQLDAAALTQALAQSDAAKALISTYAEDVLNAAIGAGKAPALTADTVMDILSPHMEEITAIVENSLPENVQIDPAKLNGAVEKAASAVLPVLVESLPPAEEMAGTIVKQESPAVTTVMDAIRLIRSGELRLLLIAAIAVLSLFVFLLRLPGFSGLRWVGTQALTAGILSGAMGFLFQTTLAKNFLSSVVAGGEAVFDAVLSSLSSALMPFLPIYGIAGLVLLIASGILNHFFARVGSED